ncbi:MAG: dihydrofolate reductase family protein [Anaerolineae bacterium]
MRAIRLYMRLSADGFAVGPNGEMPWEQLSQDPEVSRYTAELYGRADTMLLGRVSYDQFKDYWALSAIDPLLDPGLRAFARRINAMEKLVFTRTLERAGWQNCRLVKQDIVREMEELKEQPGGDIILAGGPTLAREFMRLGLIDEYHLAVYPVILGAGKALFAGLDSPQQLDLAGEQRTAGGVVLVHYRPGKVLVREQAA